MSEPATTFHCRVCGFEETFPDYWFNAPDRVFSTAGGLAAKAGWSNHDAGHLCPACREFIESLPWPDKVKP